MSFDKYFGYYIMDIVLHVLRWNDGTFLKICYLIWITYNLNIFSYTPG